MKVQGCLSNVEDIMLPHSFHKAKVSIPLSTHRCWRMFFGSEQADFKGEDLTSSKGILKSLIKLGKPMYNYRHEYFFQDTWLPSSRTSVYEHLPIGHSWERQRSINTLITPYYLSDINNTTSEIVEYHLIRVCQTLLMSYWSSHCILTIDSLNSWDKTFLKLTCTNLFSNTAFYVLCKFIKIN